MSVASLENVVVVLDQPQDLVNIAGVVRAMKNMGLSRLRLVRPGEFDAYRITGIAHRSDDILDHTEVFGDLAAAVADAVFVVGTTARARTAQRNYAHPRDLAPRILERASHGSVALVFGREDRGLDNEALDLCHVAAIVPTDLAYSSLNLAQACLILAYELFLAAGAAPEELPRGRRSTRPATSAELEATFAALRGGLERLDFFKARKAESVMRTLRTLVTRAEPDVQEARLVRAVGFEIGNYLDRMAGADEGASAGAADGGARSGQGSLPGPGGSQEDPSE